MAAWVKGVQLAGVVGAVVLGWAGVTGRLTFLIPDPDPRACDLAPVTAQEVDALIARADATIAEYGAYVHDIVQGYNRDAFAQLIDRSLVDVIADDPRLPFRIAALHVFMSRLGGRLRYTLHAETYNSSPERSSYRSVTYAYILPQSAFGVTDFLSPTLEIDAELALRRLPSSRGAVEPGEYDIVTDIPRTGNIESPIVGGLPLSAGCPEVPSAEWDVAFRAAHVDP